VVFENQGDALARRVDMTTHALSYPVEFTQQEVVIPLASSAIPQSVTLTGFRSGECKNIQIWLSRDADTTGAVKNPFNWYLPSDVQVTYAGEVFARFDAGSGLLWNLVNGRLSPAANDVGLADNGAGGGAGAITITTPKQDYWLELPFAQTFDPVTAHSMYMAGKPITNGIVNLQLTTPSAQADWKLHVSYNYNAVLTFSQGTCDYVL
jgi:hypothetical protein